MLAIFWLARVKIPRAGACLSASKSEEERKTWGQQEELPLSSTSWPEISLVESNTATASNIAPGI